jgi:exodeoxyribonuclease V
MLNKQQEEVVQLVKEWFGTYRETKKQVFTIAGYAGTGKTFTINYLVENILNLKPYQVAFGTPTGKAASVLIQKGQEASTIHRLIYTPIETEIKTKINGEEVRSKRIDFVKKDTIPDYKLIVIDEISMVEEEIMKDLLSYGIPILCTGDIGQLPAIFKSNDFLQHPDYILTEIVRQAADNPIVQLATMARNKIPIPFGIYGKEVIVIPREALRIDQMQNMLLNADQVICGTNSMRNYLNNEIRSLKGIDIIKNKLPLKGEKIICTVNNWLLYIDTSERYNLVNGTMGFSENCNMEDDNIKLGKISFIPDFLEETANDVLFDSGIFTEQEYTYDMHQRVFIMPNRKYILKEAPRSKQEGETMQDYRARLMKYVRASKESMSEKQINRIDFGYAITVHKAQGSEWNKIVVFDESFMFSDSEKWLYTAITRAKKRLVLIR